MKYGKSIPPISEDDQERFWRHVDRGEHWIWTGDLRRGYGRFRVGGQTFTAHRVAWVLVTGVDPEGEVLDHTCGQTACVNPAHLDDVTQSENSKRGANGYRARTLCRARLHDITNPENVTEGAHGRQCRECLREARRRYEAKRREDPEFRAAKAQRRREWGERTGYRKRDDETRSMDTR